MFAFNFIIEENHIPLKVHRWRKKNNHLWLMRELINTLAIIHVTLYSDI